MVSVMRNIGQYFALLLVAGFLTAVVYQLQRASMVEVAIASVCNTMGSYGLYATLARVAAARKLHGSAYAARSAQIWQVFRGTRLALEMQVYASRLIAGGMILIAATILSGRVPLLLVVGAAFYSAQWLLFRMAAASLPPALIMLGSSSPSLGQALHDFRAALAPLRVVSLLDVDEAGPQHDPDRLDNFRTSDDADWKPVFAVMRSAARVILLDARVDTPALRYEAQAVAASSSGQSVIVVKQDGKAALIEHLDPQASAVFGRTATFVEPDQAYETVKSALADQQGQAG
jgi:hypothetical protein